MAMTPDESREMAAAVGTMMKQMIAAEREHTTNELRAMAQRIVDLQQIVTDAAEALRLPAPLTEEQVEEQRAAYRGQVVMEAARLGVSPGELTRAKKVLDQPVVGE